nr:Clp protease N-terminal domain-containing protein [Chamaesiphon sp. VAR_48_metabat_403]
MQPNNPDLFTDKAWQAIVITMDVTKACQHQVMESEHLLKALLEQDGLATSILSNAGVNLSQFRQELESFIQKQPKISGKIGSVYLGRSVDTLLDRAEKYRKEYKDDYISIEHLLLAYPQDDRFGKQLFKTVSLEERKLKSIVFQVRGSQKVNDLNPEDRSESLSQYGRNLTELARLGILDLVFGRDNEIRRTIQILSRLTKNNLLLIGEHGVGKSAIIAGLAQRIVTGEVPQSLKNSQLISLDIGALITNIQYLNEFEERLKSVLQSAIGSHGQTIFIIDEIHTVVGAGATQVSIEVGRLLRNTIIREDLHCIGTTTRNEYHQYIEADPALKHCFQQVVVEPPSVEDTISILRGLKERYELHHGVKISDNALVAAATLSTRYLSNRFLPDKAIDLIDEAAAKFAMEITSKPEDIDEIDCKILQLEMERLSVNKDTSTSARECLQKIERELRDLKEKQCTVTAQWQSEKDTIAGIQTIKAEINAMNIRLQQAERDFDLNLAAELKYGNLMELHRTLETAETKLARSQTTGKSLLREEVTAADIIEIIAQWTGIPLAQLVATERENLL